MSGPTGDTTFSASGKPNRREVVLTLGTARRMLPLVGAVVADLLGARRRLAEIESGPELPGTHPADRPGHP